MKTKFLTICTAIVLLLTTSIGFADLTDGLVGYWSFDEPSNLGYDYSGVGNHGFLVGDVTTTVGVSGGAAHLNGSSYITIPDSPSLDLPNATGTISAFIRIDPSSSEFGIVSKESNTSYISTIAYGFHVVGSGVLGSFGFEISSGSSINGVGYQGSSLKDSQWHHMVVTFGGPGNQIIMYKDSVQVAQVNQTVATVNNLSIPVYIGVWRWQGGYKILVGDIDEVRIYNRALSADEIMELASIPVHIDVKPGSCPNPVNVKDKGVLPVAILGTEDFNVFMIDPASIRLADVAPIQSSYEDVATPVADGADICECTIAGPDGYLDFTLKFNIQEIIDALVAEFEEVNDGDEFELTLTGELNNGMPIEGKDCIVIISKGRPE